MSELADFLVEYAKSYESCDPAVVADFIHNPCIFLLRDDCVLLDSADKILEFLAAGLDTYKANDCVNFRAQLLRERRLGPRFALIDVEWTPENADGVRTMHFFTTYNLARHEGRWKVTMITRHDK